FLFAGFLPPKSAARQKAIQELRDIAATLVFYEAPQRLADTLAELAKILGPQRPAAIARELTKLFEETRRGTLAELADFYAAHEAKGEITLIVGPSEGAVAVHDLDALLKDHLRDMSLRDAVAAVSSITGVKKGEVYAKALALTKDEKSHRIQ